jgi:hypothetical protein
MWMKTKVLALSLASLLAFGSLAARADKDGKKEKKSGSPGRTRADLKVSNLKLEHKGKRSFLEGEIKDVHRPYKGGRTFEFAELKGKKWVPLKKGKIPALNQGQTFKVTDALKGKPKKGTKFRLRITPPDRTPGDDQKTITAP